MAGNNQTVWARKPPPLSNRVDKQKSYVSINSKPDHPPGKTPGQFFDGRIPTPGQKQLKNPTSPEPIKTSKNPTPRGIFLSYSQ